MSRALLCFVAFVLLGVQVRAEPREAGVTSWFGNTYTAAFTGPSIVWKYLIAEKANYDAIISAMTTETNKIMRNYYLKWCYGANVSSIAVNDTGLFAVFDFDTCREQDFDVMLIGKEYPTTQGVMNQILQTTYSNMSGLWGGKVTQLTWTYLLPGFLPTPPPPGISSNTTNKQTILLSGDYTIWQALLSKDHNANTTTVPDAIAADLSVTLGHYGCVVTSEIESITAHKSDPTKMLPGNGKSGLTVKMTINQGITNSSVYQYDQHTVSSALMSATMTETSNVYNAAAEGKTVDAVKIIAAYEDMVYSPLYCESACIISLTVLISAVYLMMIIVIITIVATKCYLVNDFDFKDIVNAGLKAYKDGF